MTETKEETAQPKENEKDVFRGAFLILVGMICWFYTEMCLKNALFPGFNEEDTQRILSGQHYVYRESADDTTCREGRFHHVSSDPRKRLTSFIFYNLIGQAVLLAFCAFVCIARLCVVESDPQIVKQLSLGVLFLLFLLAVVYVGFRLFHAQVSFALYMVGGFQNLQIFPLFVE